MLVKNGGHLVVLHVVLLSLSSLVHLTDADEEQTRNNTEHY